MNGPEAQDSLFQSEASKTTENVPRDLVRSTLRLQFPPTYIIVGVYRLFTDKLLYAPAWDKCRHATRRGLVVGGIWAALTFRLQTKFIEMFLLKSPRIMALSHRTLFGYSLPFTVATYAAFILVGSQATYILRYFLSRNIHIARDRAWMQTVTSRGKGADFWQPYVEEWDVPPRVNADSSWESFFQRRLGGWFVAYVFRQAILLPFSLYPFVGIFVTAALKAFRTARNLHQPYFEAKKMSNSQVAVFMEEHKWDYRLFGFAAALLEGIPIIGLAFTISNRVGAAMWAHDLEKRQHYVATQRQNKMMR